MDHLLISPLYIPFPPSVFDKNRAADRREWILQKYNDKTTTTPSQSDNSITFQHFIDHEMIHFSNADNIRSLPSLIDGLKPSQRKVLYACRKRDLKKEMKVAQLSGYCAEHTAYHHGEASLHATIIGMAQDFVGSNNINLLLPLGQFGTRFSGGADAASPRYIYTALNPLVSFIFPPVDDVLLKRREDDGQIIEPEFYVPVIPMLLVNGSKGIGTGWSTYIPPYHPLDVTASIRAKLHDVHTTPIRPWVRSFTGEIEPSNDGTTYITRGKIKKLSPTTIQITELPVSTWTTNYKQHLLSMRNKGDIHSFVEDHTTTSVSFTVTLKSVQLARYIHQGNLYKAFHLEKKLALTNMNAFDERNVIRKFHSPEEIMEVYFPVRRALYRKRKQLLEKRMNYNALLLKNKSRFIESVLDGNIDLLQKGSRLSKTDTVELLSELGFMTFSELSAMNAREEMENMLLDEDKDTTTADGKDFDYLLNMPLSSLTAERVDKLTNEAAEMKEKLDIVCKTPPEDLWRDDLDALRSEL